MPSIAKINIKIDFVTLNLYLNFSVPQKYKNLAASSLKQLLELGAQGAYFRTQCLGHDEGKCRICASNILPYFVHCAPNARLLPPPLAGAMEWVCRMRICAPNI